MIETPRLSGLPLAESDLPVLHELHADRRILAAFDEQPGTDDETHEFLLRKLRHWQEHGFGIWMFRDAEDAFVGRCGIHRWRGEIELGYIVRSELWSQGYATEMAQAVAGHAFGELNLHELVAFTREQNAASQRVMVKVGFVYESEFIDVGARPSRAATSSRSPATISISAASMVATRMPRRACGESSTSCPRKGEQLRWQEPESP